MILASSLADSQLGVENALQRCRRNEYRINKPVLSSTMAVEAACGKDLDWLMCHYGPDVLAFDVVDHRRRLHWSMGEARAVQWVSLVFW